MPLLQVQLNGGPPQTGGLTASYEDVVRLRLISPGTVTRSIRWEIRGYPEGWSTPSGWTLDADSRAMVSSVVQPPDFTLPAEADELWGKWLFVLILDGVEADSASAVEIVSPNLGLHALPAGEAGQFGGASQQWGKHLEANLRVLDAAGAGGGGGPPTGAAGGDLGGTYPKPSVTKLRGVALDASVADIVDPGVMLVHNGTNIVPSEAPSGDDQIPVWISPVLAFVPYAINRSVITIDLTGLGASPSISAGSFNAGLVVLSGTLAADTTVTLPSQPGRSWLFRRATTGTYTLKIVGADTGATYLLPDQQRRLSVDDTDRLLGEGLRVLEFEAQVNLGTAALTNGTATFALCKLPADVAVSQADIVGVVTLSGGDGTYVCAVGTAAGGIGPGYDQLVAEGAVPAAHALRGAATGDAGSEMTSGDSYSTSARTVYLRVTTSGQTVAPNAGVVRVLLVARWLGV